MSISKKVIYRRVKISYIFGRTASCFTRVSPAMKDVSKSIKNIVEPFSVKKNTFLTISLGKFFHDRRLDTQEDL